MDAADKADILRRWSALQRVLGRPEHELTWRNCMRELDLDKRTRCLDCSTEDGGSYIVRNDVWALTGLVYADGVLCLDCLSHRRGEFGEGRLSKPSDDKADCEALSGLFAGALSRFRNFGAHTNRTFEDVLAAMEELMLASRLLRIIDERRPT